MQYSGDVCRNQDFSGSNCSVTSILSMCGSLTAKRDSIGVSTSRIFLSVKKALARFNIAARREADAALDNGCQVGRVVITSGPANLFISLFVPAIRPS